jgi:hypothetical protein
MPLKKIDQDDSVAEPFVILLNAQVSDLGEAEDALENPKRMLDFVSTARPGRVFARDLTCAESH